MCYVDYPIVPCSVKYMEKSKYRPGLSDPLMTSLFATVALNAFRTLDPLEDDLDGKPRMPVCIFAHTIEH